MSNQGDRPAENALNAPNGVSIENLTIVHPNETTLHQSEAHQPQDRPDAGIQQQNYWNSRNDSEQGYSTSGGESGISFPTTNLIGLGSTFTTDPSPVPASESALEPTPMNDAESSKNQMLVQHTFAQFQQQPPPPQQQLQQQPPHAMTTNNMFLPGGFDLGGTFLPGTVFSQAQLAPGQMYRYFPCGGQPHKGQVQIQQNMLQQTQPLFGGGFGFPNQVQWTPQNAHVQNSMNPGIVSFAAGASFPSSVAAGTLSTVPLAASAPFHAVLPAGLPVGRKKRKYDHESFPEKLHRLILESQANGKTHIVRFTPDGARFEVLHTKNFEAEVLPHYFRHNKATSFKRVLRMYGFSRVKGTWLQGTFEHPLFHRNFPEMCKQIQRIESPGAMNGRKIKKSDDDS
eukprot:scaffold11998_cov174-Amphora_coffeaeformis.AAC.18